MLTSLHIRNFTLIGELSIDFHPGFSVITGETGAGKSIIVGAIGLVTGNRADVKCIKSGADKCVVEAHFDLSGYEWKELFEQNDMEYDGDDCILRREVSLNGKSRAFINDTPASLAQLRLLGERLIDIHSQHQNLLLRQENFQLGVVDTVADDADLLADYKSLYQRLAREKERLRLLTEKIQADKANEDFMRYQLNELAEMHLQRDEQGELEQSVETLSHVEEIKSSLYKAGCHLDGDEANVMQMVKEASQALHTIESLHPMAGELAARLDSAYIELKDISQEVDEAAETVDFEPERLQQLQDRLDAIYALQQKHHVSSENELIDIYQDLKQKVEDIDDGENILLQQQQVVRESEANARAAAARLSERRRDAAGKIEQKMQDYLIPLGIPHVQFKVRLAAKEFSPDGADAVAFLFSANTSTSAEPISQVASGGEIARVMLSLKAMISATVKLPTVIFDEIDTGVSGRVAEKMACIMRDMGNNHRQVISITHLPQIAALGEQHYKVEKSEQADGTMSRVTMLTAEERVTEIAQMLSGSDVTEAAMSNARTLLANANAKLNE